MVFTKASRRRPASNHRTKNALKIAFEMAGSAAIGPAALNNPTFRTMADLLNNQDIKEWLKKLPEWDLEKKHIERTFEFDDFTLAMDFVNSVAEIAEEEDHHPNIDIRYNKVRIELSTHSEGGLTDMDFEVAEKIDTLVEE
jgi:4a-hydroxytetrahydrobiopterin dehydratase